MTAPPALLVEGGRWTHPDGRAAELPGYGHLMGRHRLELPCGFCRRSVAGR